MIKKNVERYSYLAKLLHKNYKKEVLEIHPPKIGKQDIRAVVKNLKSNKISTYGDDTKIFEKKLSNFTKAKYVLCTSSGTAALHLSLLSLGLGKNHEILVPSFNFISSTNAILYVNATPHFVDCDDSFGIDILKLDTYLKEIGYIKNGKLINKKTKRHISCCIPTYPYGYAFNIFGLMKICKKFNIRILEDSSEALGTFIKNKHAGTFGQIGVLSFNGNKIISSGAGGALMTNNKKFYERAKFMSKLSRKKLNNNDFYSSIGFNYYMPALNASLGISQLKKIKKIKKEKKKMNRDLKKILNDFYGASVYDFKNFSADNNYWLQIIRINTNIFRIDKIISILQKKKIQTKKLWPSVDTFPYLKKFPKMKIKKAKTIENEYLILPSNI